MSHGQNALVNTLLADLDRVCPQPISVIVTENIPDRVGLVMTGLGFPVRHLVNAAPKGFGSNHNAAFAYCSSPVYCVVNPDIRLDHDPLAALLEALQAPSVGVAGPLVRNPAGGVEDSARRFPTVTSLLRKFIRPSRGPDYIRGDGPVRVDWIAGMFMAFRAEAYRAVGGFDEKFFLYYEDVDICARLKKRGLGACFVPAASVTHDARRTSRRDLRFMGIHAASALRYLMRSYR